MFDKEHYHAPSGLGISDVRAFCDVVERHLLSAGVPTSELSESVTAQLARRVAPSALNSYSTFQAAVSLAAFEVGEVGERICRYRYIERYKYFFETEDREMAAAFGEHLYEVRNSQIYAVLERGAEIIRLFSVIASECGLGDQSAANGYLKEFRAKFQRRLRERHRQTHAHERPSLVSRILSLSPQSEEERNQAAEVLAMILAQARFALKLLQNRNKDDHLAMPDDSSEFQEYYLGTVDNEATEMWGIFSAWVRRAVGAAESDAASS